MISSYLRVILVRWLSGSPSAGQSACAAGPRRSHRRPASSSPRSRRRDGSRGLALSAGPDPCCRSGGETSEQCSRGRRHTSVEERRTETGCALLLLLQGGPFSRSGVASSTERVTAEGERKILRWWWCVFSGYCLCVGGWLCCLHEREDYDALFSLFPVSKKKGFLCLSEACLDRGSLPKSPNGPH